MNQLNPALFWENFDIRKITLPGVNRDFISQLQKKLPKYDMVSITGQTSIPNFVILCNFKLNFGYESHFISKLTMTDVEFFKLLRVSGFSLVKLFFISCTVFLWIPLSVYLEFKYLVIPWWSTNGHQWRPGTVAAVCRCSSKVWGPAFSLKRLQHRCFFVKIAKFLRKAFYRTLWFN